MNRKFQHNIYLQEICKVNFIYFDQNLIKLLYEISTLLFHGKYKNVYYQILTYCENMNRLSPNPPPILGQSNLKSAYGGA